VSAVRSDAGLAPGCGPWVDVVVCVVAFVLAALPGRGLAQSSTWVAVGPTAGSLGLDEDLADYRWDTQPAAQLGARVLAGRGPFALGLCAWRAETTQGTGLPAVATEPRVALSTLAAVGLVRVASPLGCGLWVGGQAGRLHAGWEPGELAVDTGAGAPVTVAFRDVDEWCFGLSAELQRPLGRDLVVAVQGERSAFALDTAHRQGETIDNDRDRFTTWSVRLQLAWRWAL